MGLIITPEALKWLSAKKYDTICVDVEFIQVNTCCCSRFINCDLTYKAPAEVEKYSVMTVDGIQVFLPSRIRMPEDREVTIQVKSTFGIKSLKVEGLSAEKVFSC